MMIQITSVILGLFGVGIAAGWKYEDADKWPGLCTTGKKQSPINIQTANVVYDKTLGNITTKNYEMTTNVISLINTGHTVEVLLDISLSFELEKGGGLENEYKLRYLSFHWGSEHTIDGKRYAAEIHFVHKISTVRMMENAKKLPHGVAILAYLFEEDTSDNDALNVIITNLNKVQKSMNDPTAKFPARLTLSDITIGNAFYRYWGSTTAPECHEAVVWSVFSKPIKISRKQLDAFKSLDYTDTAVKKSNYRPVQPIGDRKVTTNVKTSTNPNPKTKTNTDSSVIFALNYACFVVSILSIII